jgi:hypothetical protein
VQSEVLSGWKDIANYLGKGVRTVQRYERELSLPIRRPSRNARGSVMATQSELKSWVTACQLIERSQSRVASELPSCTALKNQIIELKRLREQTKELRAEMRASCMALRETVRRIQMEAKTET